MVPMSRPAPQKNAKPAAPMPGRGAPMMARHMPPPMPAQAPQMAQKAPMPGFNKGSEDVGSPNMGAAGGEPMPGYDAQSGSYPNVDAHFVAHLRAAMGMGPPAQHYAGGTSNVMMAAPGQSDLGSDMLARASAPQQASAPAPQTPPPAATPDPYRTLPFFQRMMLSVPSNAPVDNAPTMQPSGNGFGMLLGKSMAGAPPDQPTFAQQPVPRGEPTFAQQPSPQAPSLSAILGAVQAAPATHVVATSANGAQRAIPLDDPHMVDAVSKGTGAPAATVNAMINPHHYTRDEFINAMENAPAYQVEALWNMQHYLNPQQRAAQAYSGELDQGITDAQAEYDKALQTKQPRSTLEKYQKDLQQSIAARSTYRKKAAEGQLSYAPDN